MKESEIAYRWTDAWLLLAIIYSSGRKPAILKDIVGAGDAINHAIFNDEEFESGLYRLTQGGWVAESPPGFRPTEKTDRAFRSIRSKGLGMFDENKELEKVLGAKPWQPDEPMPHPENQFRYPGFSCEELAKATKQYSKEAWATIRKLEKKDAR
jgi:hypothetical protein